MVDRAWIEHASTSQPKKQCHQTLFGHLVWKAGLEPANKVLQTPFEPLEAFPVGSSDRIWICVSWSKAKYLWPLDDGALFGGDAMIWTWKSRFSVSKVPIYLTSPLVRRKRVELLHSDWKSDRLPLTSTTLMVRNERIELSCLHWQWSRLPLTSIPLWWAGADLNCRFLISKTRVMSD